MFYRVEFPPCVQWLTIEFDPMSGTAQPEDYLLVSIPKQAPILTTSTSPLDQACSQYEDSEAIDGAASFESDNLGICKNARLTASFDTFAKEKKSGSGEEDEWHIAQMFNKYEATIILFSLTLFHKISSYSRSSHWTQNALILPGNKVNISLETATNYAHDQHANNFGFKCLIIGYDNPSLVSYNIFVDLTI